MSACSFDEENISRSLYAQIESLHVLAKAGLVAVCFHVLEDANSVFLELASLCITRMGAIASKELPALRLEFPKLLAKHCLAHSRDSICVVI